MRADRSCVEGRGVEGRGVEGRDGAGREGSGGFRLTSIKVKKDMKASTA